jgi:hypothetical protein
MVSRLKRIYTVFEFKIDESKSMAYKSWNFEMRDPPRFGLAEGLGVKMFMARNWCGTRQQTEGARVGLDGRPDRIDCY